LISLNLENYLTPVIEQRDKPRNDGITSRWLRADRWQNA